jgi:hypothetical protein
MLLGFCGNLKLHKDFLELVIILFVLLKFAHVCYSRLDRVLLLRHNRLRYWELACIEVNVGLEVDHIIFEEPVRVVSLENVVLDIITKHAPLTKEIVLGQSAIVLKRHSRYKQLAVN